MLQDTCIVDKLLIIDYRNASRRSRVSHTSKLGLKNFLSFIDANHQLNQANIRRCSLEVHSLHTSGNSTVPDNASNTVH